MNAPSRPVGQYSLETLFLLTTVIALHCGVLVADQCLGTVVLVIGILALFRTIIATRCMVDGGAAVSLVDKLRQYFVSWFFTLVASFFAMYVLALGLILAIGCTSAREHTARLGGLLSLTLATLGWLAFPGSFVASGASFYFIFWRTLWLDRAGTVDKSINEAQSSAGQNRSRGLNAE